MLSLDTNILLAASDERNNAFTRAMSFIAGLNDREDVAISEFVLLELYVLLRNPAIMIKPRTPVQAVESCNAWRSHPRWQVLGFPHDSRDFHDAFWIKLEEPGFARRRADDGRMALALIRQGVDEFATVNVKDFKDFEFRRVWNPLTS